MKKNILTLTIAAITSITLISGFAFAWFASSESSEIVSVSTGKIIIIEKELDTGLANTTVMPSDILQVNKQMLQKNEKITNEGTRPAIVKITFKDQITAKLTNIVPTDTSEAVKGDYAVDGTYTRARIDEVANLQIDVTDTTSKSDFVLIDGDYYALIPAGGSANPGIINLHISKELGGGVTDITNGTRTPYRQFEQNTEFKLKYKIESVQNTEQALRDFFNNTVADHIKQNHPIWLS